MAAVAKLHALKQPPIPLNQVVPFADYPTVRVVAVHTTGADANRVEHTRKLDIPFCPDASDKERLLRVLHEFNDACADARLHIAWADRYTKIRDVLGGDLRTAWDNHINGIQVADCTQANWPEHVRQFVRFYLPSNAFLLQKEYLSNTVKPKNMDCYTLNSRLGLINSLSIFMPGSGGNQLLDDDTAKKNAFFKLMLPDWQLKHTSNGHVLDNNAYTLTMLVDFMEQQRIFYDAEQDAKRRHANYNPGRFNSYGRGNFAAGRFGNNAPPPPQGYGRGYSPGYAYGPPQGGFRHHSPRRNSPYHAQTPGRGPPQGRTPARGRGNSTPFRSPYQLRPRTGRGPPPPPGARRNLNFYQDNRRQAPHQDHYYQESVEDNVYPAQAPPSYDQDSHSQDHYFNDDATDYASAQSHLSAAQHSQYYDAATYDDQYYVADEHAYAQDDWMQDY